ncbi:hypothetical protein BD626DRAFT_207051 [Schizophyllum amplum]|uniref:Uncharacterized protein n=1 Tax=Schizophyllum amplum TaxID=97359 RepID=A0A550BYX5_9AGAR|nr:hypothetical protein BD626DRAFT_207051 [Auriculariopsis ampla]
MQRRERWRASSFAAMCCDRAPSVLAETAAGDRCSHQLLSLWVYTARRTCGGRGCWHRVSTPALTEFRSIFQASTKFSTAKFPCCEPSSGSLSVASPRHLGRKNVRRGLMGSIADWTRVAIAGEGIERAAGRADATDATYVRNLHRRWPLCPSVRHEHEG